MYDLLYVYVAPQHINILFGINDSVYENIYNLIVIQ